MAGFLDAIPQFNPYISQMPLEQMAQVGMYKQQKYDEGVQKIQSYIDNVAGLDVVKPIHKQYLQSKMDELGNKLKTVAAGDFSNSQLVNSVGGMATQIVKDSVIQSAVASTQKIRKGQQELETARKAGKNSIQNEAWWNKTTNDWMNDGDLNSSFDGKYVEYTDMEKKLREVAKDVHEYDNSIEVPFLRNNKGETLYFYKDKSGREIATTDASKGQTKIDQAILKTKVKGKSAEKILENFYGSLDPNDMQQLKIDGWYHYKGYTGDSFKNKLKTDIIETFDKKKKGAEEELVKLAAEVASNSNLTADQKIAKQALINKYTEFLNNGGLQKQLDKQLTNIDSQDELSLKQSVYTEKFLTKLADDISYQDMQTEYKDNPYWKAYMDTKDLQFKYWNAQREQANSNRTFGLALKEDARKEREFNYKVAQDMLQKQGPTKIWEYLGTQTEGKSIPTLNLIEAGINNTESDMNAFIATNQNLLIGENAKNMTSAQKIQTMQDLVKQYTVNPRMYEGDNNKQRLMERYRSMQTDLTRQRSTYLAIKNESDERFKKRFDENIGNAGGVAFKGGGGYSAQELLMEYDKIKQFTKVTPVYSGIGGLGGGTTMQTTTDKEGILNMYKGTKYEPLAKAYVKRQEGQPLTATEKTILDKTTYLEGAIGQKVKSLLTEKQKFESSKLARLLPQYQMKVTSYDPTNDIDKKSINSLISNMYGLHGNLGSLDTDKFDPDKISKWVKDKEDLRYLLVKSDDGSSAKFIVRNGKESQEIPLNAKQLRTYFPEAAKTNMLDEAKYMIINSPSRTTNAVGSISGGPDAAINAAYSGETLPLLQGTNLSGRVRFDIEGAKDNDGDDNDVYQIRMYVLDDNNVWKDDLVNKGGYTTLGGVSDLLREIGVTKYEEVKNKK